MTDRKPDVYLESILDTLQGNAPADVPPASWNYEKILVAILNELKSGNVNLSPVLLVTCNFISVGNELSFEDYTGATYAEMVAAKKAGKDILAYCLDPDGRAGTPTWLCPIEGDDPGTIAYFAGTTDFSAGSGGAYNEVAFYIAEDECAIDNIFTWQKTAL